MIGPVEQIGLALMIFSIMLGMGATIDLAQFRETAKAPKPLLIGLFSQIGLMPPIALGLGLAFDLPPAIAISLILVGCTPGGTTSNLYTYFAKGDVALSITMTVASTIVAIVAMPILVGIYTSPYQSADIQIPLANIVVTLVLVLVPVTLGMLIRRKFPSFAPKLERFGAGVGILFIVFLITKFLIQRMDLILATTPSIYISAILLGIVGFVFGYLASKFLGLSAKQSRTVALETGIQNTPLTVAIIALSFAGASQDEYLLLPAFYAACIVITSAFAALIFRRMAR